MSPSFRRPISILGNAAIAAFFLLSAAVRGQVLKTTLTTGVNAECVAVNPATDKIYVLGPNTDIVTIIDGKTDTAANLTGLGLTPVYVAVNPVTNKIYVANQGQDVMGTPTESSIQVIDGATNVITTLASGVNPHCIAVNPVTNKIYVADVGDNNVTVIDGATNNLTTVPLGGTASSSAIAVNTVTNKIYVGSGTVLTVIDGATNNPTTQLTIGGETTAISVNEVTNKIYVASGFDSTVAVVNGATETVTTNLNIGETYPCAIAINPVTNIVYVADTNTSALTIIDGATNSFANISLATGSIPYSVAVDPGTNQVYVSDADASNVSVFNGASAGAPSTAALSATIGVGQGPVIVGINPLTHKAYVGNSLSDSISVIEETTIATATASVGVNPVAVALNPVTNRLYVVNEGDATTSYNGSLSVMDATTLAVQATVPLSMLPYRIAINPVTNQIYVAVQGDFSGAVVDVDGNSNTVVGDANVSNNLSALVVNPASNQVYAAAFQGSLTIIDGTTLAETYPPGLSPTSLALNPATNRVYATSGSTVTVLDGSSGANLASITVPNGAGGAIAVNPVTNMIYVSNSSGEANEVSIINGATNAVVTSVNADLDVDGIAVNTQTNQIYVVAQGGGGNGYVTVINGATNATSLITNIPQFPKTIAVNEATNQVYVGDTGAGSDESYGGTAVSVINGFTNAVTNVTVGSGPSAIAVNPITDMAYVVNIGSNTVSAIGTQRALPLSVSIAGVSGNETSNPTPTISFTAQSLFSPTAPAIQNVYYQVDSFQGAWTQATGGPSFSGTLAALSPGLHVLYAYTEDGQDATATQISSPLTSGIAVYDFVVVGPATHFLVSAPSTPIAGASTSVTVTALDEFNNPAASYAGTVGLTSSDTRATLPAAAALTNGTGTFPVTFYTFGTQTVTATDTVTPAITGTSASLTVGPGPAVQFLVSAPSTASPGTAFNVTVTAIDVAENIAINYGGAFNFTSSDGLASLPQGNYLSNGVGTFSVTLNTAGTQTVTATDTAAPSITGVSSSIAVSGGGPPPTIKMEPVPQSIDSGSTAVFTIVASAPVALTYQWQLNGVNLTNGSGISGVNGPQLVISGAGSGNGGSYTCIVTAGSGVAQSNAAALTVTTTSNPGIATSISTRAFVGTGDNILIGGFYIVGSTSRTVLVQGLGPALTPLGVSGALAHPELSIHQIQSGHDVTLYSDIGWSTNTGAAEQQVLLAAAAGAFATPVLTQGSADSELLLTLPPGGYSAEVGGADGGTGVALCAIYELP